MQENQDNDQQSVRGRAGTALVTGASGGIGYELARLLARDGYGLVLVARSADLLSDIAAEFRSDFGVPVDAVSLDLSRAQAPDELFQRLETHAVAVDVLVNNAGFGTYGPFAVTDLGAELDMIQLNIVTLTQLSKLVLPGMLQRGRGRILNVASTAAFQPGPRMAVYFASKAYVLSLSEALDEELRTLPVTVSTLCPGPTRTGFQRRARMADSRLADGLLFMDAKEVARQGYEAMNRGQRIVITGWRNRLLTGSVRFIPRRWVTRLVSRMTA